MCILAWNWRPDSDTPLLLVGNRDEYYARPTRALHWWEGDQILAGKDLQAGGTWLGVNRHGRLAALTNYRLPVVDTAARPSRGELTIRFLQNEISAPKYLRALVLEADQYNPFNLLVWDGQVLLGLESRHKQIVTLSPGIGAVSNADFDTPWPKVRQLKASLSNQCRHGRTSVIDLLPLLQDQTPAHESDLPCTGVSPEWESLLSATFIASSNYGTRASTIVQVNAGNTVFFEQSYVAAGLSVATQHRFEI
jgi:uncharacterized protein with NRDE domain